MKISLDNQHNILVFGGFAVLLAGLGFIYWPLAPVALGLAAAAIGVYASLRER